ncbi:MAG: PadR family transcriptional regulator [Candidatus Eremiobacteraeota bacterium]|nr:PadR family transcriptional regulator [Candidatus Eremiobacteraeota bacterium]
MRNHHHRGGGPRFRHSPDHRHHHRDLHERSERGRGGPGRFFESGELRYVLLHLIRDTPRHGYDIIKQIENLSQGAHTPSPGIIYPTLTLLEEMGLASVSSEGSRKLYVATELGRQELQEKKNSVDSILGRLQAASERFMRERPPQILRAMENLKTVLRMGSGKWNADQLLAVTEIIDEAAKKIERLP